MCVCVCVIYHVRKSPVALAIFRGGDSVNLLTIKGGGGGALPKIIRFSLFIYT